VGESGKGYPRKGKGPMDYMFRGISPIQLDDKGRLMLPKRYRDRLVEGANNQLICTIETEARCLLLYPLSEWEMIEQKLEQLPSFNRAARRIQRLLIGHATEVEIDGQGRILIAQSLRDYASLEKGVILVGQGKKFEIWDENQWNQLRMSLLEESLDTGNEVPIDLTSLSL